MSRAPAGQLIGPGPQAVAAVRRSRSGSGTLRAGRAGRRKRTGTASGSMWTRSPVRSSTSTGRPCAPLPAAARVPDLRCCCRGCCSCCCCGCHPGYQAPWSAATPTPGTPYGGGRGRAPMTMADIEAEKRAFRAAAAAGKPMDAGSNMSALFAEEVDMDELMDESQRAGRGSQSATASVTQAQPQQPTSAAGQTHTTGAGSANSSGLAALGIKVNFQGSAHGGSEAGSQSQASGKAIALHELEKQLTGAPPEHGPDSSTSQPPGPAGGAVGGAAGGAVGGAAGGAAGGAVGGAAGAASGSAVAHVNRLVLSCTRDPSLLSSEAHPALS
ncbi:hypothetical protein HaLaN_25572 [Haematococcus lacustris]|uniref:Uncharacterized protein n=1 Tax=Haematococcus lacustris TaxID=44745 RepID=A0A6A0A3N1_HAELA|nr:hypothetical protein HaLaN_25572 [Haematococcus lacustris]